MCRAVGHGIVSKNDFACFVYNKSFPAADEKLLFHSEHIQDFVVRITQQGKWQTVIFCNIPMALYRPGVDTDHHGPCAVKFLIIIPERTGFFGADRAFVFWIKIDDQDLPADIVSDAEQTVVLIPKGKSRNGIPHLQGFALRITALQNIRE